MDAAPNINLVSSRLGQPRAYRMAGVRLLTDIELPALNSYTEEGNVAWWIGRDLPTEAVGERVFDGEGLIADSQRRVVVNVSAAGYRLAVEGIATYGITLDGGQIAEVEVDPRACYDTQAVAALGAPLILALALRGTFCIHASVVVHGQKLLAFIGESGQGKSTLAAYLDHCRTDGWRRVIDDTLPVGPVAGPTVVAFPHFPQLKMPDEVQPSRLVPMQMALSAVYVLENDAEVAVMPVPCSQAVLALAAQTVGGRLFGRDLLTRHLGFCSELAGRVPVRRLVYPRSFDALPEVREALAADIAKL